MGRNKTSAGRRSILVFLLLVLLPLGGQATWLAQPAAAQNDQEGDNSSDTAQEGASGSGDAIAGQTVGVVTGGSTSVDATNESRDVDVTTGDAEAGNTVTGTVGQVESAEEGGFSGEPSLFCANDIDNAILFDVFCEINAIASAANTQDGDNESDLSQAASATTGDAVGGQVIGVVSPGDTDIVASNTSEEIDITTGDADAVNDASFSVGQTALAAGGALDSPAIICANDIGFALLTSIECVIDSTAQATNTQEGDNTSDLSQAANASSGDGVGGQVIGVVSTGTTSIDATNSSEDVDITTGDVDAVNDATFDVGQLAIAEAGDQTGTAITCGNEIGAIILSVIVCTSDTSATAANTQTGDNASDMAQAADATSGDGVGGQVIGAVSSGSTDIVASNSSRDVEIDTGDSSATNDADAFVGQLADAAAGEQTDATIACGNGIGLVLLSIISCTIETTADAANTQDGDNGYELAQAAEASTGDGVGGQVIGTVSAGSASIDATNSSEDIDVTTGDADAFSDAEDFVGQRADAQGGSLVVPLIAGPNGLGAFIFDVFVEVNSLATEAENLQVSDNSSDVAQTSTASSGDAVGGQVAGVVTSAGGSADLVLANTSEGIDAETGTADDDNFTGEFVGQQALGIPEPGIFF